MKNIDIKTELNQLRYEKHLINVKINNRIRAGKEIGELAKQFENLSTQISNLAKSVSKNTQKKSESTQKRVVKKTSKTIAWPELTYKQAEKQLKTWMEENDYCDGYQFNHSINFFMHKPIISQDKKNKEIKLEFQLQFLTKSRKVVKDIVWHFPYGQWARISDRLESLERVIAKETSDPDRSDQVFGYDRFQKVLFFEKGYDKIGWKIRK